MGHTFDKVFDDIAYPFEYIAKWCHFGDPDQNTRTCTDIIGPVAMAGLLPGNPIGPVGAGILVDPNADNPPNVVYFVNRLDSNIIITLGIPPGYVVPGLTPGTMLQPKSVPPPVPGLPPATTYLMWAAHLPFSVPRFPYTIGSADQLPPCPTSPPPTVDTCTCSRKVYAIMDGDTIMDWTSDVSLQFLITVGGNQYTIPPPTKMTVGQPVNDIFPGLVMLLIPLQGMDVSYVARVLTIEDPNETSNVEAGPDNDPVLFYVFIERNLFGGVRFQLNPAHASDVWAAMITNDPSVPYYGTVTIVLKGRRGAADVSWDWTWSKSQPPQPVEVCLPVGGFDTMVLVTPFGTFSAVCYTNMADLADFTQQSFAFNDLMLKAVVVPTPPGGFYSTYGPTIDAPDSVLASTASMAYPCCGGPGTLGACSACSLYPCVITAIVEFETNTTGQGAPSLNPYLVNDYSRLLLANNMQGGGGRGRAKSTPSTTTTSRTTSMTTAPDAAASIVVVTISALVLIGALVCAVLLTTRGAVGAARRGNGRRF
jgi:hypothetical protein